MCMCVSMDVFVSLFLPIQQGLAGKKTERFCIFALAKLVLWGFRRACKITSSIWTESELLIISSCEHSPASALLVLFSCQLSLFQRKHVLPKVSVNYTLEIIILGYSEIAFHNNVYMKYVFLLPEKILCRCIISSSNKNVKIKDL